MNKKLNLKPLTFLLVVPLFCVCLVSLSCSVSDEKNKATAMLYARATEEYNRGDFDSARKILKELLLSDRNFYPAALLEAKLLFFQDKLPEAQVGFAKLVKKYPHYTEARLWQIRCSILGENGEEARKLLDNELLFNPSDWRVYYLYAFWASLRDNYELRIAMLDRAEIHLEESAKVYIEQSKIRLALGQNRRSREYLERAKVAGGGAFAELTSLLEQNDDVFAKERKEEENP